MVLTWLWFTFFCIFLGIIRHWLINNLFLCIQGWLSRSNYYIVQSHSCLDCRYQCPFFFELEPLQSLSSPLARDCWLSWNYCALRSLPCASVSTSISFWKSDIFRSTSGNGHTSFPYVVGTLKSPATCVHLPTTLYSCSTLFYGGR